MNENQEIIYDWLYLNLLNDDIHPFSAIYYLIRNIKELPNEIYVAYTQLSKEDETYILLNLSEDYLHYKDKK